MYYIYILQSLKDQMYYIGVTNNVRRRINEHNKGISKSTAPRRPFVLKRVERFTSIQDAYERELFLKSKKNKKIIEKVIESSPDFKINKNVGTSVL